MGGRPADRAVFSSPATTASARPGLAGRSVRKLWLSIHLFLGLAVGGMFVLIGLTGSALVFYKTIDEWLNPAVLRTVGAGAFRPLNEIVTRTLEACPPNGRLESLRFPDHAGGTFGAWYKIPAEVPGTVRRIQVTIDPYTGAVLSGEREWGRTPVSFLYELHESLLLEKTGKTLMGCVGLVFLVSIGTGICVWWPRTGTWRQAFGRQSGQSVIRRHYDVHKLSGVYSAILLTVLACTGVYLEFSTYLIPLVRAVSPVRELPKEKELHSVPPEAAAKAMAVEETMVLARQMFPDGEVKFLAVPQDADGVFRIGIRQPGEARKSSALSQVWLDQYSGAVLSLRDWRTFTAGETFIAWLFPLHNGEAFGLTGRWIVFVTGFLPLILYITALRMWWLKREAHRRQRIKADLPIGMVRLPPLTASTEPIDRQSNLDP